MLFLLSGLHFPRGLGALRAQSRLCLASGWSVGRLSGTIFPELVSLQCTGGPAVPCDPSWRSTQARVLPAQREVGFWGVGGETVHPKPGLQTGHTPQGFIFTI